MDIIHVIMRSLIKSLDDGKSLMVEMVYIEHTNNGKVLSFVKDISTDQYHMLPGNDHSADPVGDFWRTLEKYEDDGWRRVSESAFDVDMNDAEEWDALVWEFKQMLNIENPGELSRLTSLVQKMRNRRIGDMIKEQLEKEEGPKIATTNSELLGSW